MKCRGPSCGSRWPSVDCDLRRCGRWSSSSSTGGTTPPVTPTVNNVQAVVVDSGPTLNGQPIGANDELFTTVTICVPGTTTCQSIDHVLVDTGSSGLRFSVEHWSR